MKRMKEFHELRVSVQQRLIKAAFQPQGARQTLFIGLRKTWNRTTKGGRVHVRVGWVLRLSSHLTGAVISAGVSGSAWCLVSALRQRVREQALTSGTPRGNNGDAPQCDSRRQEQTQTQELSILPLRQTCRGLRMWRRNSLSLCLRFINMF